MRALCILIFVVVLGCQKQTGESKKDTIYTNETGKVDSLRNADLEKNQFSDYVNKLPQINLPFKFFCDSGLVWAKLDYESDVIKKYKPEGAGIIGTVYQTDKSVGILYTYPADITFPVIQIFNNVGEKLEEIELFEEGNCVSDENYSAVTRGQITSDLQLISWSEIVNCDNKVKKCDTIRSHLERKIN